MGFFEFCVYFKKMVFLGSLLGILGFGVGISIGVIVGYFLFIYYEPRDVKVNCYCFLLERLIVFFVLFWFDHYRTVTI